MKKVLLMTLAVCLLPFSSSVADTLVLQTRDVYKGRVTEDRVVLNTGYGRVVVTRPFVRSMTRTDPVDMAVQLLTVNNDILTGRLVSESVGLEDTTGEDRRFYGEDIREMYVEHTGPTREVDTTLFFMAGGDKFSGRLDTRTLHLETDIDTIALDAGRVQQIGILGGAGATVRLDDGSVLMGTLVEKKLAVRPDAFQPMVICVDRFDTIRFNVQKLVAGRYEAASDDDVDSDGDGVPDTIDACADTPCGETVEDTGCPPRTDADNDGVTDDDDLCPDTPPGMEVDDTGCALHADADGDGVFDDVDQCPRTPTGVKADDAGCWVIDLPLFDFKASQIKPEHYPVLDEVVDVLKRHPSIRIEVQGHSDSMGPAEVNQRLTEARARSVMAYLVEKGIDPDRLTAVGYGATRPAMPNDTEEGRAMNRRVELRPLE